jgi:hypothetical protein
MREEIPDDDVSLDELTEIDEEEVAREDMADELVADGAGEEPEKPAEEPIRHRNPRRVIEALRESKALRELLADEFLELDMDIDMDEPSLR